MNKIPIVYRMVHFVITSCPVFTRPCELKDCMECEYFSGIHIAPALAQNINVKCRGE